MKTCTVCEIEKPINDFYPSKYRIDGHDYACKECERAKRRLRYHKNIDREREYNKRFTKIKYCSLSSKDKHSKHLTKYWKGKGSKSAHIEYHKLLKEQNGVCAICKKSEIAKHKGTIKNLAVDHRHSDGKVRGLLCGNCNRAIGMLKDDPELLLAAANYLVLNRF